MPQTPKPSKVSKRAYSIFMLEQVVLVNFDAMVIRSGDSYELIIKDVQLAECETLARYLLSKLSEAQAFDFCQLLKDTLSADLKPELHSLYYNGQLAD